MFVIKDFAGCFQNPVIQRSAPRHPSRRQSVPCRSCQGQSNARVEARTQIPKRIGIERDLHHSELGCADENGQMIDSSSVRVLLNFVAGGRSRHADEVSNAERCGRSRFGALPFPAEFQKRGRPYSSGSSVRSSSSRGTNLLREMMRAHVFHRSSASSWPGGRIASAFSNQCIAS